MANWWEELCRWWQGFMGDSFAAGYWLAVAIVGSILVLWLLIHFLLWLLLRRRRATAVILRHGNGDIEVAEQAIYQCIHALTPDFPDFQIQKMKLYRQGKSYMLRLEFEYNAVNDKLADNLDRFKQKIFDRMSEVFHIRSIRKISFKLVALKSVSRKAPDELADIGVQ